MTISALPLAGIIFFSLFSVPGAIQWDRHLFFIPMTPTLLFCLGWIECRHVFLRLLIYSPLLWESVSRDLTTISSGLQLNSVTASWHVWARVYLSVCTILCVCPLQSAQLVFPPVNGALAMAERTHIHMYEDTCAGLLLHSLEAALRMKILRGRASSLVILRPKRVTNTLLGSLEHTFGKWKKTEGLERARNTYTIS